MHTAEHNNEKVTSQQQQQQQKEIFPFSLSLRYRKDLNHKKIYIHHPDGIIRHFKKNEREYHLHQKLQLSKCVDNFLRWSPIIFFSKILCNIIFRKKTKVTLYIFTYDYMYKIILLHLKRNRDFFFYWNGPVIDFLNVL